MHFVDEVGEGLLNHGPALIAELLHGGLLRFFPERQGFQKRSLPSARERQHPATVAAFRRDRHKPLLLERPEISRQCGALHLQGVGQRFDRKRAARAHGRQHRNLGRP